MHSAVGRLGLAAAALALISTAAPTTNIAHADARATSELPIAPEAIVASGAPAAPEAPPEASPEAVAAAVAAAAVAALLDERVAAGRHWRLDTAHGGVHVWVPVDYDAATAAAVVFIHGYWIGADEAWTSYRLAEQFALSGINAMFIVPEAPAAKWDPIAWPSLGDLLRTVGAGVDAALPSQRLVAVGHSGAYRTLGPWLANPALDTVVLLDAAYVDYGLLPWLRKSPQRRLVNIAYETQRYSNYLHRRLPSTVRVDGLPHDELPDARILYIRTAVGHWELVTDGIALPLALRAIGVAPLVHTPHGLPLGLPPRRDPPPAAEACASGLAPRILEFAP